MGPPISGPLCGLRQTVSRGDVQCTHGNVVYVTDNNGNADGWAERRFEFPSGPHAYLWWQPGEIFQGRDVADLSVMLISSHQDEHELARSFAPPWMAQGNTVADILFRAAADRVRAPE
eukprot:5648211-Pyramimonas_sp.AAC.1